MHGPLGHMAKFTKLVKLNSSEKKDFYLSNFFLLNTCSCKKSLIDRMKNVHVCPLEGGGGQNWVKFGSRS